MSTAKITKSSEMYKLMCLQWRIVLWLVCQTDCRRASGLSKGTVALNIVVLQSHKKFSTVSVYSGVQIL